MNRTDNHQPLSTHNLSFAKAESIGQTFVSHRPGLNIVSICLRNPNRLLTPLKFDLIDDQSIIVRSINFTAGNIDSFDCTKFQFDPIIGSAGKSYLAQITPILDPSLILKDQELTKSGIYIESHGGGDYLGGQALVNGQTTDYDLHFKTLYRQENLAIFKESYQDFFARVTKDPLFFLGFILFLGLVIWKYRKAK